MAGAITRTQFLRGDFTNQHAPIRPPWSRGEALFLENCTQCFDCLSSCPEKIIIKGEAQYPQIDFAKGECTFCFKCVQSCEHQALTGSPESIPWTIKASINKHCLALNGVHCMGCRDHCESEAIRFIPKVGQAAYPVINPLLCSGCGACFKPCPNQSIKLNYQPTYQTISDSTLKETTL
ncbi:MAG: ferredoxin-type protein NapF [Gammaproteobacteria bacterium]|nr:ferredoxin-type protein NapF [Gammaproteobacteria bacterium]